MKLKPSKNFIVATTLIFASFFIFQSTVSPYIKDGYMQQAAVLNSFLNKNTPTLSITPSTIKNNAFVFDYKFSSSIRNEKSFDAEIIPFDNLNKNKDIIDFGTVKDVWGYPLKYNKYHSLAKSQLKAKEINTKETGGVGTNKNLDPGLDVGMYNCRANTNITGYFEAYFEDVALDTNVGFDDPNFGQGRREEACQVLQDISELIKLDQTTVTPDIIFLANQNIPPGALAAATAYFLTDDYFDNGTLHRHIISREDPTPDTGDFDALVIVNFNGIFWDVDSTLNPSTYDFYTVIYHEILHNLGFRSRLPAAIGQSGIPHNHGTFDLYQFKDTLNNPFFNQLLGILNVPIGAPSSWFVANDVIYRGVKNIIGAIPDGIRPIFSPTSWQQGSSLSHFDMNRAPGEIYVMHPSISTNTERLIHDHEKEVLCHLGYQVDGLLGCELASPFAQDDSILVVDDPICILPLGNDIGFNNQSLSVYTLDPVLLQTGDTMTYYPTNNCTGTALSNPNFAKSINFIPSQINGNRTLVYTNKDILSGRHSLPALIKMTSCEVDQYEYVCNGDFEMNTLSFVDLLTQFNSAFFCSNNYSPTVTVPFWCNFAGTPDLVNANGVFSVLPNLNNPITDLKFSRIWYSGSYGGKSEGIITKLKQPLTSGQEYVLSFDMYASNPIVTQDYIKVGLKELPSVDPHPNFPLDPVDQMIVDELILESNNWYHIEKNFIANDDYQAVSFWGDRYFIDTENIFFDNISIRPANAPILTGDNSVSGYVYQDFNQNGNKDSTENGLVGVSVSVYKQGQTQPFSTTTTQDVPNQGKYEFNSLPDDNYRIVLSDEQIYQSITEPLLNPGLVSGYDYPASVSLSGGQSVTDKDFGVSLIGDPVIQTDDNMVDIKVAKDLIDSTLSANDPYITWRIRVANISQNSATNIVVSDVFPAGLTYVSHSLLNNQNTFNPNNGILNIVSLNPSEQTHVDIKMLVPKTACGTKTNAAHLMSVTQIDSNTSNNSSTASIKLKTCGIRVAPTVK